MASWQGMQNKNKVKGIVVYPTIARAKIVLASITNGKNNYWLNSTRFFGINQLHAWHNGKCVNVYFLSKHTNGLTGMLKMAYSAKRTKTFTQLTYVQ